MNIQPFLTLSYLNHVWHMSWVLPTIDRVGQAWSVPDLIRQLWPAALALPSSHAAGWEDFADRDSPEQLWPWHQQWLSLRTTWRHSIWCLLSLRLDVTRGQSYVACNLKNVPQGFSNLSLERSPVRNYRSTYCWHNNNQLKMYLSWNVHVIILCNHDFWWRYWGKCLRSWCALFLYF